MAFSMLVLECGYIIRAHVKLLHNKAMEFLLVSRIHVKFVYPRRTPWVQKSWHGGRGLPSSRTV